MCKIKDVYQLELQTPEKMKLFSCTRNLANKTKNIEKVASLEVVSIQWKLVDNQYQ